MTDQLSVEFRARDAGEDDALKHLGERECDVVRKWIREIGEAAGAAGFTSVSVYDALPSWVRLRVDLAPNSMGALFRRALKDGIIAPHPTEPSRISTKRGARGRRVGAWILTSTTE